MFNYIEYLTSLLPLFLILCLAAFAQSLMSGYTGIIFVASAAFMGIGAYTSAILSIQLKLPLLLSISIAVITATVSGVIVSIFLKNIRKDYLAIGTLGLGLILNEIYINWESLTRGSLGITNVPILSENSTTLILTISVIVALVIFSYLTRSNFGSLIRAIRDDEVLVQSLGKSTFMPLMVVYAISFSLLGLAGAYLAHFLRYIDPSSFALLDSIAILVIVIIGGIESPMGAVLGAAVYVYLPATLKLVGLPDDLAAHIRQGLFGLALILLMVIRPQGLIGKYRIK